MSTDSEALNNTTTCIEAYGAYPFSSDETYQQGLGSILAGGTLNGNWQSEVREELERRTRVFYFNKITGSSITANEARDYELSQTRVLTFGELKELIESGNVDKIPNNKIIPEKLNDALPSQSTAPTKKKPWEMETST